MARELGGLLGTFASWGSVRLADAHVREAIEWRPPREIALTIHPFWRTAPRPTGGKAAFTYVRPDPEPPFWEPRPPVEAVWHMGWTIVYSPRALTLDEVAADRLYPLWRAGAQLALDYARALGVLVELAKVDRDDRVALLFKNPRGSWQLSYFDRRGPAGHDEGDDPVTLVYEAMSTGYRRWASGTLDRWAPSFDPELLRQMSAPR